MTQVGDKIPYFERVRGEIVEAEVIAVNEDGTVNIRKPHPYVADVMCEEDSYALSGVLRDSGLDALPSLPQSDALATITRSVTKELV